MNQPPRNEQILIVRLAALGDVARATSLLARIRHERPSARVTWIAGTGAAPLLKLVPGIDRLVQVDEARLFRGAAPLQLVEVVRLWAKLASTTFDLAVLAHPDRRYRALLAGVRARQVRVLDKPTRESRAYVADEFAQLLDDAPIRAGQYPLADLRNAVSSIELPVTLASGQRDLSRRDDGTPRAATRPTVLLVPGGARNMLRDDPLRRWPLESYAILARELVAAGHEVAILGADSDAWVRGAFAGIPVHDLVGRLDIAETLRLMSEPSVVVVTHDTGPLHLAQLVRARTVALFGPTVPSRVIGLPENVISLWGGENLACRPCYDGTAYAPCERNRCMEDISVDAVMSAVGEASGAGAPSRQPARKPLIRLERRP